MSCLGLFFFFISYLSFSQWSGSCRCIQLWATVMLPKSAWQYLCSAHIARSHRYCRPLADLLLSVHSLHAWLHKKSSCLVFVKAKKYVQSPSCQHHLVVLASSNLLVLSWHRSCKMRPWKIKEQIPKNHTVNSKLTWTYSLANTMSHIFSYKNSHNNNSNYYYYIIII